MTPGNVNKRSKKHVNNIEEKPAIYIGSYFP